MIWIDIFAPKDVMFFTPIIKELYRRNVPVLVTTRSCKGYTEITELLKLNQINFDDIGIFGGANLADKLSASIERQKYLMEHIAEYNVSKLVSLSSVDATRVAFGLGIPIYNFYDIPLSDYKTNFTRALPQARLTIPLSTKMFKPFVVPDEIFMRFSLEKEQIIEYNFIDPLIWLKDFKPDFDYVKNILANYDVDFDKHLILIREEEYKASYVNKKYPFLYESLPLIKEKFNANIVIIPRYESDYLKREFPFAVVIEEKIIVQHLLAFADMFIGGGGTMNTESCFFGTPTVSTRSFISHYDKYQIDNGLMHWVENKKQLIDAVETLMGKRNEKKAKEVFGKMNVDMDFFIDEILKNDRN